ncbi:hypothetical protein PENPOL_c007G10210 [Penicillium polonicum]|uniref:Carboxylesterase type B domain-containing protein n=1 Tax=Penicillium polonicum TaxID=60169 RepID=A0A1V6NIZ8_PENPO|nr:hypothetical protein PENPOL_c007G10210 [Penicillium polonicum]
MSTRSNVDPRGVPAKPGVHVVTALIPVLQNIADLSFLATATPANHIDPPYDSPVWNVGQSVRTTSGLVVGHSATNASEVSEYVGIPYAAPPLGRLRFQPPVRYTGNDTISATAFGPACIQPKQQYQQFTTPEPWYSPYLCRSLRKRAIPSYYRVNTFGFPSNPATPANIGLRDFRMSLEWIRDNIEQFSGDPERITIFG